MSRLDDLAAFDIALQEASIQINKEMVQLATQWPLLRQELELLLPAASFGPTIQTSSRTSSLRLVAGSNVRRAT